MNKNSIIISLKRSNHRNLRYHNFVDYVLKYILLLFINNRNQNYDI